MDNARTGQDRAHIVYVYKYIVHAETYVPVIRRYVHHVHTRPLSNVIRLKSTSEYFRIELVASEGASVGDGAESRKIKRKNIGEYLFVRNAQKFGWSHCYAAGRGGG